MKSKKFIIIELNDFDMTLLDVKDTLDEAYIAMKERFTELIIKDGYEPEYIEKTDISDYPDSDKEYYEENKWHLTKCKGIYYGEQHSNTLWKIFEI